MSKTISLIIVIGILVINLLVRVLWLDKSPAYINWDEASLGINAKCLAENLRDEYGKLLPVNLRSLDDYKPALYSYLSAPMVKMFGLNQFSIRLLSAISGVLTLWGIYLVSGLYIKNKWVRILGLAMIGLGPLRLHYSRVAVETNLSSMMMVWGLWFILKDKLKTALIFFILGILSYHSARVMVPVLLFLLLIDPIKRKINWKYLKIVIVIGFIVGGLSLIVLGSLNRFGTESLMRLWPFVPRNTGNWLYYLGFYMSGHFLSMINPMNLISNNYEWFTNSVSNVSQNGLIGITMAILFLIGVFQIKDWKEKKIRYLGYWFLAAILPVVLTWNWFYPLRSLNALIVIEIIGLIGLEKIIEKKVIVSGFIIFFCWEALFVINNEFNYSNFKNYLGYQATGIKEITEYLKDKNFDKVIVDTKQENAYSFYEFYGNTDCGTIQDVKENKSKGFGNYEFRKIDWENDFDLKRTIFISEETGKDYMAKEKGYKVKLIDSPLKLYQASMVMIPD